MNKHIVLISRLWENPNISIDVTDDGIKISMSLKDFIKQLANEVGNPALLFSKASMLEKIELSAEKVVSRMKEESTRVM